MSAPLTPPDLYEEYDLALAGYQRQQIAAGKRLRALGVRMTAYLPWFGLARIEQLSATRYAPTAYEWEIGDAPKKGLQALIIPVVGEDGESLLDLLAFYGDEGHFLRRTGVGGGLDLDYAERTIYERGLLNVAASPLAWLRRGGNALCVLDWNDPQIFHMLRWARELHAGDDLDLAEQLYKTLRQPIKRTIPNVLFDNGLTGKGRAA